MASKKKSPKGQPNQLIETLRPQTPFERAVAAFLSVILLLLLFIATEAAAVMVLLLRIVARG